MTRHLTLVSETTPPAEYTPPPFSRRERVDAMALLTRFVGRTEFRAEQDAAFERVFDTPGGFNSEQLSRYLRTEDGHMALFNFLAFDFEIRPDKALVDEFLHERGQELLDGERAYLEAMRASHVRVYEVLHVVPKIAVELRDLTNGNECLATEPRSLWKFEQGQLIAMRLVKMPHRAPSVEAVDCIFPSASRNALKRAIATALRNASKRGEDDTQMFKQFAPILLGLWTRAERWTQNELQHAVVGPC